MTTTTVVKEWTWGSRRVTHQKHTSDEERKRLGGGGFGGDGGPATEAKLNAPAGLAFDAAGNLYIADQGNDRVRRVDTEGVITTVAGGG